MTQDAEVGISSAAEWHARQESGPLSPAEKQALQRWLASSEEHARDYARVAKMLERMDLALAVTRLTSATPARVPQRRGRRRAISFGALAASLLIAVVLGPDVITHIRADEATATGEVRLVALPDGSSMRLNTASAAIIRYTPSERTIELLEGEADFRITPDAVRPFVVEAAGGRTRALGTEFIVRRRKDGATITVLEHTVSIEYSGAAPRANDNAVHPIAIAMAHEGEQVSYSPGTGLTAANTVDRESVGAWRRGWLTFENRPLGEVVTELNRYYRGHIHLSSSTLSNVRVTCAIPLDGPADVARTLENTLGLKSLRLTSRLVFLYEPSR